MSHNPTSKIARVLQKLKDEKVVSNWELNKIAFRYSAIIHDLRKEGHIIKTRQVNTDGAFEFIYQGHADDEPEPAQHFSTKAVHVELDR